MYAIDTSKCDNTISGDDSSLLSTAVPPSLSSSTSYQHPCAPSCIFVSFISAYITTAVSKSSYQLRWGWATFWLGLFTFIQSLQKMLTPSNFSSDHVVSRRDSSLLSRSLLLPNVLRVTGQNVPRCCRWAVVCKLNCKAHSLPHHKCTHQNKRQWQHHCDLLFSPPPYLITSVCNSDDHAD